LNKFFLLLLPLLLIPMLAYANQGTSGEYIHIKHIAGGCPIDPYESCITDIQITYNDFKTWENYTSEELRELDCSELNWVANEWYGYNTSYRMTYKEFLTLLVEKECWGDDGMIPQFDRSLEVPEEFRESEAGV